MKDFRIVVGGRWRARKALAEQVRVEVAEKYAVQLSKAPWKRLFLEWKAQKEIRRRMKELAPPYALYLRK